MFINPTVHQLMVETLEEYHQQEPILQPLQIQTTTDEYFEYLDAGICDPFQSYEVPPSIASTAALDMDPTVHEMMMQTLEDFHQQEPVIQPVQIYAAPEEYLQAQRAATPSRSESGLPGEATHLASRTLADLGITHGDTLWLSACLRGGVGQQPTLIFE